MTKKVLLVLIGILLLSFISGIYRLTAVPPALNQDEAVNGYDAFTLGINLRDHHGNFLPPMLESFGDWASPLITYLTIPFVKIFGLSLFSIRLVVALLGVGSVYLMYLLLKEIFIRNDLALLGTFIFAVSPWRFTLSRWAIPPGIVPFFLLLFLLTFLRAVKIHQKDGSNWYYLIPGLAAGLLTYAYPTMKLFVPMFILTLTLIYLRGKSIFIFLISFLILVSPIYVLTLSDPKYNARFVGVTGLTTKNEIISRYVDYFLPNFQFLTGDTDYMHQVPGTGNSYLFLSVFFYLGILICLLCQFKVITIRNIDPKTYSLLLVWLLLFPVAASLTRDRNMVLRVVHGLPLVIMYSALTFAYLWQLLKKPYTSVFIVVVCLAGIFSFGKFMQFYFTQYPDLVFKNFQYGIAQYTNFLFQNESKFDKVVIDSNINQPYIYLLFYSKLPPGKLNYQNPRLSFPKYTFATVPGGLEQNLLTVFSVRYQDTLQYAVYSKDSTWYVKQY